MIKQTHTHIPICTMCLCVCEYVCTCLCFTFKPFRFAHHIWQAHCPPHVTVLPEDSCRLPSPVNILIVSDGFGGAPWGHHAWYHQLWISSLHFLTYSPIISNPIHEHHKDKCRPGIWGSGKPEKNGKKTDGFGSAFRQLIKVHGTPNISRPYHGFSAAKPVAVQPRWNHIPWPWAAGHRGVECPRRSSTCPMLPHHGRSCAAPCRGWCLMRSPHLSAAQWV